MMARRLIPITQYGLTAILLLGYTANASAVVTHIEIPLPLQDIPSVSDFQTTGAEMAGMEVTAFFSAGAPETVVWATTGVSSGEAAGTNWRLSQAGDTFTAPWTLLYEGGSGLLTGFRIDGFAAGPGNVGVMFDRTFDAMFGTPDSFLGRDLELVAPVPFDVFVGYQGAVGVAGNAPVGDEFRWLNARFVNFGGIDDEFTSVPPSPAGLDGVNSRVLEFRQDTNNPIVPEPASAALLGIGALSFGAFMLRRRRKC